MVDGTEDSSSEGLAAAAVGRRERRGGSRGGDNQLSDELRCPISLEVMANRGLGVTDDLLPTLTPTLTLTLT